jgi:endonuclease-3
MTKKEKAQVIRNTIAELEKRYPETTSPGTKDPLEQLLVSLVSFDSPRDAAAKALLLFEEEFVDWNEVRVSAVPEIASVLQRAGIEEGRARTIKTVLNELFLKKNQLSLEFLLKYKEKQAYDYLSRFEGLPQAVIDEVMLLGLGHPVCPVTEDILRVCRGLGVVGDKDDAESVRKLLMATVPKSSMAMAYALLKAHAPHVKETRKAEPAVKRKPAAGKSGKKGASSKKSKESSPSAARR